MSSSRTHHQIPVPAAPNSPQERGGLGLSYRYSIAHLELATDVIFRRSAPLQALFGRAAELGLLLGGDQTTHIFGRRITSRYRGKIQTVLERRDEGHHGWRNRCLVAGRRCGKGRRAVSG